MINWNKDLSWSKPKNVLESIPRVKLKVLFVLVETCLRKFVCPQFPVAFQHKADHWQALFETLQVRGQKNRCAYYYIYSKHVSLIKTKSILN